MLPVTPLAKTRSSSLRITGSAIRMLLALYFLSSLIGLINSAHAIDAGWFRATPSIYADHVHSISEILQTRSDSQSTALIRAKQIIRDLSSSPACTHGPTARLLKQCKLIKPRGENHASTEQLENAQSTYGICMALCETQEARVPAPPACTIFQNLLEPHSSAPVIEIIRPDEIKDCLSQLFANQASWTSFSNFKQQSFDLCDSSRFDYQREELLQHFREATDIIPEIIDALRDYQYETQLAMQALREEAHKVTEAQKEIRFQAQQQEMIAKESLALLVEQIEHMVGQLEYTGLRMQDVMSNNTDEASKDLSMIKDKATSLQLNLAEVYASAAEAVSVMTFDVESKFEILASKANNVAEQIVSLGSGEYLQNIRESIAISQDAAVEFNRIQVAQSELAERQLVSSQNVLQAIEDTRAKASEMSQAIDMLPTSFFGVIQRVREHMVYIRAKAICSIALTSSNVPDSIGPENVQVLLWCLAVPLCIGAIAALVALRKSDTVAIKPRVHSRPVQGHFKSHVSTHNPREVKSPRSKDFLASTRTATTDKVDIKPDKNRHIRASTVPV